MIFNIDVVTRKYMPLDTNYRALATFSINGHDVQHYCGATINHALEGMYDILKDSFTQKALKGTFICFFEQETENSDRIKYFERTLNVNQPFMR